MPATGELVRRGDRAAPEIARVPRRLSVVRPAPDSALARRISAQTLVGTAARFVSNWGLATVPMVLERVQLLTDTDLGEEEAARVLAETPRFRWLDRASGWFSFVGRTSRLAVAARKILAVARSVSYAEIRQALSKQRRLVASLPRPVLEAYLVAIVGCEIAGEEVRARAGLAPARIGGDERALVDLLLAQGGRMPRAAVRAHAAQLGLAPANLRRLVRESPLVVGGPGRLRVVGLGAPATGG